MLIDGASARYIWPIQKNDVGYCGWVNAKNTFGAYTGYRIFYVLGARTNAGIYKVNGPPDFDEIAERMCRDLGYPVHSPPLP